MYLVEHFNTNGEWIDTTRAYSVRQAAAIAESILEKEEGSVVIKKAAEHQARKNKLS